MSVSNDSLRVVSGILIAAGLTIAAVCTGGGALLAAGVLVGAGSGSLFIGNFTEKNGGEFSDGWTAGLIAGGLMGAFTGAAGNIMLAKDLTASTIGLGLGGTFGGGFISGFSGSLVYQTLAGNSYNINEALMIGAYATVIAPAFTMTGMAASGFAELGMFGVASSALVTGIVIDYGTQWWYNHVNNSINPNRIEPNVPRR